MTLQPPPKWPYLTPGKEINAELILKSVDPAINRCRAYKISILTTVIQRPVYIVILAWGRIGHRMQKKTHLCENRQDLDDLLQTVLKLRRRHRYILVNRSSNFPTYGILQTTPLLVPPKDIALF